MRPAPYRKRPEISEDSITFDIAAWLELALVGSGVAWTHFPAGEKRTAKTGAKLKRMGLKPGWPDFQFVVPVRIGQGTTGRYVGIEIKKKGGAQRASQKIVEAQLRNTGAYYHIAHNIPEVAEILTDHGVTLRARAV